MSRWIRVQTSIFDHELFSGSEFSELDAWLWLIAKAAWRETAHRVGGVLLSVPVGSLFITLRELQRTWRWKSDTRVRNFLKILENERMIVTDANAGKTQITICNYERFQNPERTENAEGTQEETHGKRTENALKTPVIPFHQNSLRENAVAENFDFVGFEDWFATWPTSLTDDKGDATAQWHGLTSEQRLSVRSATPSYIEAVKASGRRTWPTAAKFLAQRMWERVGDKPLPKRQRDRATIERAIAGDDSPDTQTPRPLQRRRKKSGQTGELSGPPT